MPDLTELSPIPEVDDADRVVDLIARLPKGSIVRRMAVQVLQGRPIESVQPLFNALMTPGIRRWRERQVAAWALGRTSLPEADREDAVCHLMDVVEGGYRQPFLGRFWRSLGVTSITAFSFFILGCVLFGPMRYDEDNLLALTVMHVMFSFVCVPLTLAHEGLTHGRIRASAANSLGRIGAVEAIGPLAAALQDRNQEVRAAAAQALHVLLPQVAAEHFGMFSTPAVESLGSALFHPDGQLVFKVLAALEKVGTSAAIPYVQRAYDRGRTQRVRAAAEVVLRVLHERKLRETERDRLLRPTMGLHDPSVLLRTPTAASEDTSLLLQPASDGG